MTQESELKVKVDTTQVKKADKDLDNLAKTGKKTDTAMSKLTKSFQVQKGATQNAAFQLQDLTVQMEGGTNASRALAQQLPQMLGAFGAGGAILGLFASLASIAFADLIDGLFEAEKATDDLDKAMEALQETVKVGDDGVITLTESFRRLAQESRAVAEVQLQAALVTSAEASKAAISGLSAAFKKLDANSASLYQRAILGLDSATVILEGMGKEFGITATQAGVLEKAVDKALGSNKLEDFQAAQKTMNEIALSTDKTTGAYLKLAVKVNKATAELEKQKKINDEIKRAQGDIGAISGADPFDINEIGPGDRGAFSGFEAAEKAVQQRERFAQREIDIETRKQQRLDDIAEREGDRRKASLQANLSVYSSLFGQLSSLLASSDQKNFQRSKNAATAGALIDGTAATLSAYDKGAESGGVVGGALAAAAAAATTGLLIAQIQSAKPPSGSRALGGQVRPGESYRVGEYGPETLVMGSQGGNILPAGAANDSGRMETVVNVTVNGGSGNQDVQTNTTQVSDRKQIIDVVVSEMGNQNSQSRRALQQTSNVRSVGGR
jgi:hypothetical protein